MEQNGGKQKDTYYASLIEDIEFSESELIMMGIYFISEPGELKDGLYQLGVEVADEDYELSEYGCALTQVGSVRDPHWAIYSIELSLEYVLDVWGKRNFYSLSRETESGPVEVFPRAYLRERRVEEDMSYYIEMDVKSRFGLEDGNEDYIH